jgi:hypothetical protein
MEEGSGSAGREGVTTSGSGVGSARASITGSGRLRQKVAAWRDDGLVQIGSIQEYLHIRQVGVSRRI